MSVDELVRLHVDAGRRAQAALDETKCPHCACHGSTGRVIKMCQNTSCGRIWIPGGGQ